MKQALSNCPICGSERTILFYHRFFLNTAVRNRLCKTCGVVFQSPRMSMSEADEFHKHQYRNIHQAGRDAIDPSEIAFQRLRAETFLHTFSKSVLLVSNHLDIGCSGGLLMEAFMEYYSCRTTGVEIDAMYRPYALQQGFQVFETLEELPRIARYDVISMSHVLEHIPEPVKFLRKLREDLLDPAGWLYLEVPNMYAHDCFEPGHLISFSSHTLVQVIQKAGYKVVKLTCHGMPRSKIVPLYLNVLAQPTDDPGRKVKPERLVFLKRKTGRALRKLAEHFLPNVAILPVPE
jgi:2-polyprenyl-3-methyl-5-hydroxy-6-metoxy-1,4-benzoquinol methylase